ncbi:hypothetical protein N5853_07265 [Bartonella sp. HY329]|uniref:hypothetical protein n=1 Tax=unclassified Bartonella TaxID=2645622 RepID=UPI0021C7F724|nr:MULTISPECIES: hypothetical protein [unclassified Bartonella]UXM93931.1 hypothetical protein N5853_07265 [Bartonella sp. HY329]UXN08252.1 hypothetical protein N5852_07275 [Bartonella sp. HY328]
MYFSLRSLLILSFSLFWTPIVLGQTISGGGNDVHNLPSISNPTSNDGETNSSRTVDYPFNPLLGSSTVELEARLTEKSAPITKGIVWRIFSPTGGNNDTLPLIAAKEGGSVSFNLPAGEYLIHAAFGRAGITKKILVEDKKNYHENLVLNAGGIEVKATNPNGKLNESRLTFSIYAGDNENNEQALIMRNVKANAIIRLSAGQYHVVSSYGNANAISRTNVTVEGGKLTEVKLEHYAAQITLKLVREAGGEALADTSWVIQNDSGDIVRETANAYVYIVLSEGDYVAIAKNKDQIYQKEFTVQSGKDSEVEIVASPQNYVHSNGDFD